MFKLTFVFKCQSAVWTLGFIWIWLTATTEREMHTSRNNSQVGTIQPAFFSVGVQPPPSTLCHNIIQYSQLRNVQELKLHSDIRTEYLRIWWFFFLFCQILEAVRNTILLLTVSFTPSCTKPEIWKSDLIIVYCTTSRHRSVTEWN